MHDRAPRSARSGLARTAARVLALSCALLLCSLLGAELYLRAHHGPRPDLGAFVFARPALVRLRVSITRDLPALAARTSIFSTSSLGVRADEIDLRDRSAYRALTLGDSVTECLLLSDGEAWPRRLQDELAQRSKRAIWVANAAGSGELSLDYVVHMKKLVPELAPALVLIMPGGYELQAAVEEKLFPMDLADPGKLEDYAKRLYAAQNEQAHKNLAAQQASYLAYALKMYLQPDQLDMTDFYARMRARRAAHSKLQTFPGIDDALDVYKANLRAIVSAWRTLSPRPQLVLLTRPFMWKPNMTADEERTLWGGYTCMDCDDPEYYRQDVLADGLHRFNQTLLQLCVEEQLPCLDLERLVPKDLGHFYDDAHLRAEGATLVAHEVANFLIARRLVH